MLQAQEARTNMLNAMSPEDRAAFLANEERERQEKFDRIAAETERLRQARERQRQRDAEARRSTYSSSSSYGGTSRSEEHTSELQSLMRISYAVFCLKKKKKNINTTRQ